MSLDNSTMFYKYIGEDTCGSNFCPQGQFISANVSFRCQACSSFCQACAVAYDNCTAGSGCPRGYFFFNISCRAVCPPGTYADLTSQACENCSTGCELCFGSGLNKCTKCMADPANATAIYYLHPILTQCLDDCGLTNYFKQPTSFTCAICQDSCATCLNNATDCDSCRNVAGTVYYLTGNNSCVWRCPAG